jgi:hypothetical protein
MVSKLFWLPINKRILLASLKTHTNFKILLRKPQQNFSFSFSSLPLIDFLISFSAIGQFSPVNIPQPAFGTKFRFTGGSRASEEGY